MSREVEVTGIHMTATVPESIQISLGIDTNEATGFTASNAKIDSTTARLTAVTAPADDEDWSNTIDISEYYQFGYLTPATSAKGDDIFYTSDVTGVGKTLKGMKVGAEGVMMGTDTASADTKFTQADKADKLATDNGTTGYKLVSDRTSNTVPFESYKAGAGYYIDIPVWFRTSTKDDVYMAVKATFSAGSNAYTKDSEDEAKSDQLFKAARVSILEGNNAGTKTNTLTQGVIMDGSTKYYRTQDGKTLSGSAAPYTVNEANTSGAPSWTQVVSVTQFTDEMTKTDGILAKASGASEVVKIGKAGTNDTWSANDGAPYTIRIWLDGEDVNCWNATAGQDFGIQLSFCQIAHS